MVALQANRREGRRAGGIAMALIGNPDRTPFQVPDLLIDFATGAGIPAAHGGIGGRGEELVEIISPQDAGGDARLVRAPRYWDPSAQWSPGEPIFVGKQAGRLVGWPGPRDGGYWTGPMPSWSSTSETVAVVLAGAVTFGIAVPTTDVLMGEAWSVFATTAP